eukprot:Unigene18198_Nuclearia_a/m.52593 Unigene18198_Nuclearia_a/g.52593  ORF Unigene18198_Nuclearia_a/g.52593 Unigene18198_Nuclearia_a/m.52593 type:complete len:144 (-) Unigene18198_Nuclearia_a:72-503(-)
MSTPTSPTTPIGPGAAAAGGASGPGGDGANGAQPQPRLFQDEVTLGVFRPPQGFGMFIYRSTAGDGYLVDRVDERSYARSLGLKAGDLIVCVNGKDVSHWTSDKMVQALKDDGLDTLTVRSLVTELSQSSARRALEHAQQFMA